MASDTPPLNERVAFALGRVSLAVRTGWDEAARAEGLSTLQAQILGLLARRPVADPPGARAGWLAQQIGVAAATVSDALRALEAKGFVYRSHAAKDRRQVVVRTTPAGARAAARLGATPPFVPQALDTLTDEERATLFDALLKVIRALQDDGRIAPLRMCPDCAAFRPFAHDDPRRPHRCALLGRAFGPEGIRVDCDGHVPAREASGSP